VPLRRLFREWLIFAPIMIVVLWFLQHDDTTAFAGSLVGLGASLPLYLAFGYVLAKFGYQRKTLADLKTPRAATSTAATNPATPDARPKPAPTRRTSAGSNRPNRRRR
jgi:hypothetical protein